MRSPTALSAFLCTSLLASFVTAMPQGDLGAMWKDSVPDQRQVIVYRAKSVLTMEAANPRGTAIAVAGTRIVSVGSMEQVQSALGNMAFTIDDTFADKIVLPGLIDQHLHPILGALTLSVEVIANEDWVLPGRTVAAAASHDAYMARLRDAESALRDRDEVLFTWGYHHLFHGALSRQALDSIRSDRPICVWHRSCHEFYLNTAALQRFAITEAALQGHGQASQQANFAKGHFYEKGLELIAAPLLKAMATPERLRKGLEQMIASLRLAGVTAICEPGAVVTPDLMQLYQKMLGADATPFSTYFIVDGRSHFDKHGVDGALAASERQAALAPRGKVSFLERQVKLFLDGAIISQLMQMKDGYLDGHHGEWIAKPEEVEGAARVYWDAGYQLHVHVNGDLGLDVLLDTLERRMRENPRPDHRSVVVHFANSTEAQVDRIARLGAIVSSNPYYVVGFADKYGEIGLGQPRADSMVRAGSLERARIPQSFHSDLPMAPGNPLYLAWCAANRTTGSGRTAAPDQRVAVETALRAVTIEAAYSWRKEHEIGSIAPGKLANFTILEQDPLAVPVEQLAAVPIWGTVFEGRKFPNTDLPRTVGREGKRTGAATPSSQAARAASLARVAMPFVGRPCNCGGCRASWLFANLEPEAIRTAASSTAR